MESLLKLSYDEFIDYCVKNIATVLKSEYNVSANKIYKTDEWVVDSFFMTKKGDDKVKRIVTIPTKEYYLEYVESQSLGEAILKIIKETEKSFDDGENDDFTNRISVDLENVSEYDYIKSRLIIRAISYTNNQKLLKDYYFHRIGDIALTLYMDAGRHKGGFMSAKVPLDSMKDWDKEQAFEVALNNTAQKNTPVFYSFETVVSMGNEIPSRRKYFMNKESYRFKESFTHTYRLSTDVSVNGATAAFYPGVLERVAEILEDDFYLVFASTLESMIHPMKKSDKVFLKNHAVNMSKNSAFTPAADFLSSSLYVYRREGSKIEAAD